MQKGLDELRENRLGITTATLTLEVIRVEVRRLQISVAHD